MSVELSMIIYRVGITTAPSIGTATSTTHLLAAVRGLCLRRHQLTSPAALSCWPEVQHEFVSAHKTMQRPLSDYQVAIKPSIHERHAVLQVWSHRLDCKLPRFAHTEAIGLARPAFNSIASSSISRSHWSSNNYSAGRRSMHQRLLYSSAADVNG